MSASAVNPRDDVDAAVKWMMNGRIETKGFTNRLPNTSQDLRNGKVTPEKVAQDLEEIYKGKRSDLEGIGGMGVCSQDMQALSWQAAEKALPLKFFKNSQNEGTWENMIHALSNDIHTNFVQAAMAAKDRHGKVETLVVLKQAVDKSCKDWASEVDKKLFRGKKGTFLKKCPIFGIEVRRYREKSMPWGYYEYIRRFSNRKREEILPIAEAIAAGEDFSKRRCWQCHAHSDTSLEKCSRCEVARYCSRACQVTAWKEGHKQQCKELRRRHGEFRHNLSAVDKLHSSVDGARTSSGFPLCPSADYYSVLRTISIKPKKLVKLWDGTVAMSPTWSMQTFYKNMDRVTKGEWWFFEDADLNEYSKANLAQEHVAGEMTEGQYMANLGTYMTFNDEHDSWKTPLAMMMKAKFGAAMPASVFLELYSKCARPNPTDTLRIRRNAIDEVMNYFATHSHKGDPA